MKKVKFKELGKLIKERVNNDLGYEYLISDNTDDYIDVISLAEENGHFEINDGKRILVYDLEVKNIFDEEDNYIDSEYYF